MTEEINNPYESPRAEVESLTNSPLSFYLVVLNVLASLSACLCLYWTLAQTRWLPIDLPTAQSQQVGMVYTWATLILLAPIALVKMVRERYFGKWLLMTGFSLAAVLVVPVLIVLRLSGDIR